MSKNFLVTRPFHDRETSYLHNFAADVVKKVKTMRNVHVTDLEGKNVTRINLEKAVNKEKPTLVFLNGHGDPKQVLGHDDEPILDYDNIAMTDGKSFMPSLVTRLKILE